VIQNLLEIGAEGDDAHLATARRAQQREHLVDMGDQCGPQVVRWWARPALFAVTAARSGEFGASTPQQCRRWVRYAA